MAAERIRFTNERGAQLAGRLELPPGQPRAFVLFAHCFTCTKNIRAAADISRALTALGLGVLRFDFTGLGESEGDFADTTFSSNIEDLLAAARWLEREHQAPRILIGHSLGGTAVLRAAFDLPQAVAVVTIGAPARAAHVTHLLGESRSEIERRGEAEVNLGGRPFRIRKSFLDDLEAHRLPDGLNRLRKALLVMHSPTDDTVEIGNAAEIFQAAVHPKSFLSLDGADHLLSRSADSHYAAAMASAWASRFLGEAPVPADLGARDGQVVARTPADGFRTRIDAGGHALTADEPRAYGGTNLGPSPYGLLSASLAACTSMTLRMYAAHKGLALEAATVTVTHDRIHARDCEQCESDTGRVDRFERIIELDGDLTEAERRRMLDIADRCPVHRTLDGEVIVESRLR